MGNLEGPLYKKAMVPASFHFVTAAFIWRKTAAPSEPVST